LKQLNPMLKPILQQSISAVLLIFTSVTVLAETNTNRVHIDAPLTSVYQYITQPDKWHDWYPLSKSAKTPGGSLTRGQTFSEVVSVNNMDTEFNYEVVEVQTPSLWKVEFSSTLIIGSIQYQLNETIDGTLLTRTLEYYPVPSNTLEQLVMAKLATQVQPTSIKALRALQLKMESAWQATDSQQK
jgi:Polyketide cyclase / dehydrase and lipid transport